jgi:alpha-L-rhamnosidase
MIDRRLFLAGLSAIAVGVPRIRAHAKDPPLADTAALARSFNAPPGNARPWVLWFWINGNVTREAITADLEAMHRVGIGGVQIMDVDPGVPAGRAQFGSDAWHGMFNFTLHEAQRLGLTVEMSDDAGWTGSAGPWITPELSMQTVVWSETQVEGGTADFALAAPEAKRDFYRDIAVLAFPTPADDGYRVPDIGYKAGYKTIDRSRLPERGVPPLPIDPEPMGTSRAIDPAAIVDVSVQFSDGRLRWQAPNGRWTVMRIGHTSTGIDNHPASAGGQGLECDKLSKQAIKVHMDAFIGKLAAHARDLVGNTFLAAHIDSWEVGDQNWTPLFRDEFKTRRGYDLLSWLPALSGRVIGDAAMTERFLWDVRQTISDLLVDNYAAEARRLCHAMGLNLSIEAYDADPTEQMRYGAEADVPQTEFWYGDDFFSGVYRSWDWTAAMTSAAHVYGKRIIAAEAFTAMPKERWQAHPAAMKPLGDWAFTAGVNHFIFHRYALQPWPWPDRRPGMTMGAWGTHYERTQTWWELTGPWHLYLARCQHMLRQGTPIADLLYLTPEGAPMRFVAPEVDIRDAMPPDTPGYNLDGCPPDALFTRVSIRDGEIALPDGKRYRAVVLPDPAGEMPGAGTMTPRLLARIAALVEQGMTVIGPSPNRSPSLANYPVCDVEVRALSLRLWGTLVPTAPIDRRIGQGRVVWGVKPEDVLARNGLVPDFTCGEANALRYVHRRLADGSDMYFVANKQDRALTAACTFRVSGRRPEIWHPETGAIAFPAHYDGADNVTRLPLRLEAHEAVFVVFPVDAPASRSRVVAIDSDASLPADLTLWEVNGRVQARTTSSGHFTLHLANGATLPLAVPDLPPLVAVSGPWEVQFAAGWGAPDHVTLPKLTSWSEHEDPGVRYFSGTAVYRGELFVPPAMLADDITPLLDLGQVHVIARVRINGHDLGILWKAPFLADASGALQSGRNLLEIEVTNLWPNRLIGDEQLPADAEWVSADFNGITGFGEKLLRWPDWLLKGQQSPTGRRTFATWKLWTAKDKLLPSGLLGPVTLRARRQVWVS